MGLHSFGAGGAEGFVLVVEVGDGSVNERSSSYSVKAEFRGA